MFSVDVERPPRHVLAEKWTRPQAACERICFVFASIKWHIIAKNS